MFRYYLKQGHSKDELLSLSNNEKLFFIACKELDQRDEFKKYKAMMGDG